MLWSRGLGSGRSPIEGVLDRNGTLEELLDEDDLVQECRGLNSRLVSVLRERRNVEQLIRYMVEPPEDSSDPKRTYKYPFASCEVLCCELEAIYNTLLDDPELLRLLFSLLDAPAPLSSQTAGYFGRVVGNLLLRKNNEMLEYMQAQGPELLIKLVRHIATTSIAEIIKRMAGADDQTTLVPSPSMTHWLAETPLVDLLLAHLDEGNSPEAQTNAADILAATAHTQPSPLAARLAEPGTVAALVGHALAPSRQVLLPVLDVCIALLEPRRVVLGGAIGVPVAGTEQQVVPPASREAVAALVQHVPRLVETLSFETGASPSQDTTYGRIPVTLGRHRLKVVELLAVLVRSGGAAAEPAIIQSGALQQCMQLFASYPFNNILHHLVAVMLASSFSSGSEAMLTHLFEECRVLDWVTSLPLSVTPPPRAGDEELAAAKAPLRAGYMGHVTQLALALLAQTAQAHADSGGGGEEGMGQPSTLGRFVYTHEGWRRYVEEVVRPQQELENTASWACGRPQTHVAPGMESDGEDFVGFEESLLEDLDKMGGISSDRNPWGDGDSLVPDVSGHAPLAGSDAFTSTAGAALTLQSPENWERWADADGPAQGEAEHIEYLGPESPGRDAPMGLVEVLQPGEPVSAGSPMLVEPSSTGIS